MRILDERVPRLETGRREGSLARAASVMALVCMMIASSGCQRRQQFVPLRSDSTATAANDSSSIQIRQVQELWESGGSGEDAAAASARVLLGTLTTRPAAEWKDRADSFLDSLAVGAETAGGECALVVNFFSRADPTAGSWPYLFTCGDPRPVGQPIEGKGLHLFQIVTRNMQSKGRAGKESPRGVAVLFGRRSAGGQQPLLMVLEPATGGAWKLDQTLGPDSLGGVGSGEFESSSDTSVMLVARTYRTPAHFEECATCPHLFGIHRFRWGPGGFERVDDTMVPSTYATFVHFIQALMASDRDAAGAYVTNSGLVDQARRFQWDVNKGTWRIAPATDETPTRLQFLRGPQDAYRVQFEPRGNDWAISGFDPITRSME